MRLRTVYITAGTPAGGGRRTPAGGGQADTPAGGGQADTPAGGGQAGAILRMGINAYAMGEKRTRREPQRGGREDVSTRSRGKY